MNSATRPLDGESRAALSGWIGLKQQRAHQRIVENTGEPSPTMLQRVGAVLAFLGFPYQQESQLALRGSGRTNNWAHLAFECDPNDGLRGIPLFGSQAEGRYDVFCLWDARPNRIWSISDISRISGGNQNAVILLYLGALTSSERNDVKRRSWDENLTIAVVDEMLLEVLAGYERDDRFQAFLQTALPYSAYNPYNSVTAGWGARVPPEMFYGREKVAQDIQKMREGRGSPRFIMLSTYAAIASSILDSASSLSPPCEWHPGSAGQLATITPSSSERVTANSISFRAPLVLPFWKGTQGACDIGVYGFAALSASGVKIFSAIHETAGAHTASPKAFRAWRSVLAVMGNESGTPCSRAYSRGVSALMRSAPFPAATMNCRPLPPTTVRRQPAISSRRTSAR